MTNRTRTQDNLPEPMNTVADFFTWAHRDNSGLATTVSQYMGKQGAPGIPEVRRRAHEEGLDDLLQSWRDAIPRGPTTERVVRILISPDKIEEFARETGLSQTATVNGLAEVIPGIVYRNALRERQDAQAKTT